MPIELVNKSTVLTSVDLAQLELRLGFRLPEEYKEFLIEHNVAIPVANQVVFSAVTTSVDQFLGISQNPDEDLIAQRKIYDGRIPEHLLPIAQCGGGNLVCLRSTDGKVFFWDHELEDQNDMALTGLSSTFQDFLDLVVPFRPEQFLGQAKVVSVKVKPGFADKFKKFM